ncbi:hypothetical protein EV715DRAFT_292238 [Schizophyllum commune]
MSPLPRRLHCPHTPPCLAVHARDSPRRRPHSRDVEKKSGTHFRPGEGTPPPPHRLLRARLSEGSGKTTRDLPTDHDDVRAASPDLKIPARWTSSSAKTTPTSPLPEIAPTSRRLSRYTSDGSTDSEVVDARRTRTRCRADPHPIDVGKPTLPLPFDDFEGGVLPRIEEREGARRGLCGSRFRHRDTRPAPATLSER